jgi:hypothetical protein
VVPRNATARCSTTSFVALARSRWVTAASVGRKPAASTWSQWRGERSSPGSATSPRGSVTNVGSTGAASAPRSPETTIVARATAAPPASFTRTLSKLSTRRVAAPARVGIGAGREHAFAVGCRRSGCLGAAGPRGRIRPGQPERRQQRRHEADRHKHGPAATLVAVRLLVHRSFTSARRAARLLVLVAWGPWRCRPREHSGRSCPGTRSATTRIPRGCRRAAVP